MKNFLTNHLLVAFVCVMVVVSIVLSLVFIRFVTSDIALALDQSLQSQQVRLFELADRVARVELDPRSEKIVGDCPRRNEYEDLLSRLNSLSRSDIITTQQLFSECGLYFVERKDLLVAQLERELAFYQELVAVSKPLRNDQDSATELSDWEIVLEGERQRAGLLREQAGVQAEIIRLLVIDNLSSNRQIAEQIKIAESINSTMVSAQQEIDRARARLSRLYESD